jgi:hypothetical protein
VGAWDCEMAERCSGGDGRHWRTAACGQSQRKEVVLLHRTCWESLACIWFVMFFLLVQYPK